MQNKLLISMYVFIGYLVGIIMGIQIARAETIPQERKKRMAVYLAAQDCAPIRKTSYAYLWKCKDGYRWYEKRTHLPMSVIVQTHKPK